MWLFIVLARRKREKRVFSLAQYYHNTRTSKVSVIIKNTINIYIKFKLQKYLIQLTFLPKYFKKISKIPIKFS